MICQLKNSSAAKSFTYLLIPSTLLGGRDGGRKMRRRDKRCQWREEERGSRDGGRRRRRDGRQGCRE